MRIDFRRLFFMRPTLLPFVMSACLGAFATPAQAQTSPQTTTFLVSITLENHCSIAADPLNFGTYSEVTTARTAETTITVTCDGATAFTISLDAGTGTGSAFSTRHLKRTTSTDVVDYNLYTDSDHTTIFGDGTAGTTQVSGNATPTTISVYGQTASGQGAKPSGTYTSTITATVTF